MCPLFSQGQTKSTALGGWSVLRPGRSLPPHYVLKGNLLDRRVCNPEESRMEVLTVTTLPMLHILPLHIFFFPPLPMPLLSEDCCRDPAAQPILEIRDVWHSASSSPIIQEKHNYSLLFSQKAAAFLATLVAGHLEKQLSD